MGNGITKIQVSHTTFKDGDRLTVYKVGSSTVCEIDCNMSGKVIVDDTPRAQEVKRPGKAERVERIKELLKESKTRTEIKDQMYSESYYVGNPNPASAFAGDWNSIQ